MVDLSLYFSVHPWTLYVASGLIGLVVGSFLNVVIVRLPVMLDRRWRQQCAELLDQSTGDPRPPPSHRAARSDERRPFNLVFPGSHCPSCGHRITPLENIPVLSFVWLRGKCSACGHSISWRYPSVELLTGVLSAAVAWHFGFSVAMLGALFFTWALIALTLIDYDHQLLPDDITLPLLWLGLLFNFFEVMAPLHSALAGAVAGYVSLWVVYQLFKLVTGKEGMGYGDFKLVAAFGAWLGWQALPLVILLASLVGALVGLASILVLGRDRTLPIPFGPFLCVSGWIALLWGNQITRVYLQLAHFPV